MDILSGDSWLISTNRYNILAHSCHPIFGSRSSMFLYRSEVFATLTIFYLWISIVRFILLLTKGKDILYCDSKDVVHKLNTIIQNKKT